MKSLNAFQMCMKIMRVILIILVVLMATLTVFHGISLAVWISYDDISFVYKGDFYRAILEYTDIGTYYYNISFFTSKFAFSVINTTLLVYLLIFINKEISIGNPFNEECVSLVKWIGFRCLIFPVIAMLFSFLIFWYFNQGFPFYFIDLSYFAYGAIFIIASYLFKQGCKSDEE